jgi:hypothetical protein
VLQGADKTVHEKNNPSSSVNREWGEDHAIDAMKHIAKRSLARSHHIQRLKIVMDTGLDEDQQL